MCGRGLHGGGHLHEAIVKRGDLPNDPRIFVPENCCVLHEHCHKNTRQVDEICVRWLVSRYPHGVFEFIKSLGMKTVPWRVKDAIQQLGDTGHDRRGR